MRDFFVQNWEYLLTASGILLATVLVGFVFNRAAKRFIRNSTLVMNNDPTNYNFLRRAILAVVYVLGFSLAVYAIPALKTLSQSLLAGAGILAVAVGFASQQALANVIAGIFIVIFKPFRVKDRITVRDTLAGVVEDITLRHTIIRNFENRRIIIPNSIISNEVVVNADLIEQKVCRWVELNISYGSNVERAKAIMQEEVLRHPLFVDNRDEAAIQREDHPVTVRVIEMGEYFLKLRAWAWAKDNADAFAMGCDLFETIKARFDEAGVEIPVPYRAIVQKGGNG